VFCGSVRQTYLATNLVSASAEAAECTENRREDGGEAETLSSSARSLAKHAHSAVVR